MSKINVVFYQNKRSAAALKATTITCEVNYMVNGTWNRVRFATGEKCAAKHFKSQRVYHTVNYAAQINERLEEIRLNAERVYQSALKAGAIPNKQSFKDAVLNPVYAVEVERDFMADLDSFIEYHLDKGTTKGSRSHIMNLRFHLEQFSKKQRITLSYDKMNLAFYGKFISYLNSYQYRKKEHYEVNSVGNFIKKLKMFLNWAKGNGWNTFDYYKHPEFKTPQKRVENIYLEPAELQSLEALDLRKEKQLHETRQWFLLACETGMRYGDYMQLKKENLKEVPQGIDYTYTPQKTSRSSQVSVTVPLSANAVGILLRYGFEMPAPPCNQTMNIKLKELARLAGIDKSIGTHTARRTFATLRYKERFPIQAIMKITGHRTETEFYKYLCIGGEENADLFRQLNSNYQITAPGLLETRLKIA